jgi:hypothetical protein
MARLAAVLMGKFVPAPLVVAGVEVMAVAEVIMEVVVTAEVAETEAEVPPPLRRTSPLLRHHLPK